MNEEEFLNKISNVITGFVQMEIEEARQSERDRCLAIVDAEEELPGHMPDEIWSHLQTRESAVRVLRVVVQDTKASIRDRILSGS